jgi:hypothetical protein
VALVSQATEDWGGGIYSGRRAPANTVYDAVNCLVSDEGLLFRRGGSAYHSASNATSNLTHLHALYMRAPAANRVIARRTGATSIVVLDGSDAPVNLTGGTSWSRPASVGDLAVFATGPTAMIFYGGSRKTAQYATGTITVTEGSTAVTGSGTAWLANVDAGMILRVDNSHDLRAVRSIATDTTLTLASPWQGPTVAGETYDLNPTYGFSVPSGVTTGRSYVIAAGSGTPRLLFCVGNRVFFTDRGDPQSFDADTFHELPASATIIGGEGRGDSALIFTTAGAWAIGDLSLDPVDAFGNLQHSIEQVNKDVILWDDFGIAGYGGSLVVPAIDDVFLMAPDGLTPITGRIRPQYREYVEAGYQPGLAAVHRGHYFLPILNGTSLVDTLVCRLDRDAAWTTFAGGAASPAYATLIEETAREPKLLGLSAARVTDLTGCMEASASTDADGTDSDLVIETRDYPTGANQPGVALKIRARYELDGAATVTPAFSSDQDAGVFEELVSRGEQGGADGWEESDGSSYQWAFVGRKRERIRFRLTIAGACTSFVLRSLELLTRASGKQ